MRRNSLDELLSRLERQDYEPSEATLDICATAVRAYKDATPHLDLFLGQLDAARQAGLGSLDMAALLEPRSDRQP